MCYENFILQILAVGPTSAAFEALCLCRQHATSLSAVSGHTAVTKWLHQCNNNVLEKKDVHVKHDDFFQTFRDVVNTKDLNFIPAIGSVRSHVELFSHNIKKQENCALQNHFVDKLNESVCLNICASNVFWTQNLPSDRSARPVKSEGNEDSVLKAEAEPVQYDTSDSLNAGPDRENIDGNLPTLEQLEAVREYYVHQVSVCFMLVWFKLVYSHNFKTSRALFRNG